MASYCAAYVSTSVTQALARCQGLEPFDFHGAACCTEARFLPSNFTIPLYIFLALRDVKLSFLVLLAIEAIHLIMLGLNGEAFDAGVLALRSVPNLAKVLLGDIILSGSTAIFSGFLLVKITGAEPFHKKESWWSSIANVGAFALIVGSLFWAHLGTGFRVGFLFTTIAYVVAIVVLLLNTVYFQEPKAKKAKTDTSEYIFYIGWVVLAGLAHIPHLISHQFLTAADSGPRVGGSEALFHWMIMGFALVLLIIVALVASFSNLNKIYRGLLWHFVYVATGFFTVWALVTGKQGLVIVSIILLLLLVVVTGAYIVLLPTVYLEDSPADYDEDPENTKDYFRTDFERVSKTERQLM